MIDLSKPITEVEMIGKAYAERLEKLEIFTLEDLLHHYPFRYDDLTETQHVADIEADKTYVLKGQIVSIISLNTKTGKKMQKAVFADETGSIDVTWFNQPYLERTFRSNPYVTLIGKAKWYARKLSMSSPKFELMKQDSNTVSIHSGRVVPMYHCTAGVSSKWLRSRIAPQFKKDLSEIDHLSTEIITKENLFSLDKALEEIHFPTSQENYEKAKERLAFDELFFFQLKAQVSKREWKHKSTSFQYNVKDNELDSFYQSLPFELTGAQQRAIDHIMEDLATDLPMNRLVQGDVGSGKTVVAAAAVYITAKQGLPSVLMAPTEVLATQHAESLKKFLEPHGITISVQTRTVKDDIEGADVIVGTHAILHREVPDNLGLVIIDEQHRFGVKQRSQLLEQKPNPNVLSMTATPIPRTIALTLYADLDISVIDGMPKGRKIIKTWGVTKTKRAGAYDWIRKQVRETKTQVFVVCPLVQDSETPMLDQVKAAETEYERLKNDVFPNLRISLLHGKMKAKAKQEVLQDFKEHNADILVATPVIEVGIDIPNASIIVIEGAERFGLASLHQLRGRVGRGDTQSYCLLFSSKGQISPRLKNLERFHSGFDLAQIDLETRGAGELYGTRQSGDIQLKIASLTDQKLIAKTNQVVLDLLRSDEALQKHTRIMEKLEKQFEKNIQSN